MFAPVPGGGVAPAPSPPADGSGLPRPGADEGAGSGWVRPTARLRLLLPCLPSSGPWMIRNAPSAARTTTTAANTSLRWAGLRSIAAAVTSGGAAGAARTGPGRPARHRGPRCRTGRNPRRGTRSAAPRGTPARRGARPAARGGAPAARGGGGGRGAGGERAGGGGAGEGRPGEGGASGEGARTGRGGGVGRAAGWPLPGYPPAGPGALDRGLPAPPLGWLGVPGDPVRDWDGTSGPFVPARAQPDGGRAAGSSVVRGGRSSGGGGRPRAPVAPAPGRPTPPAPA